MVKIWKVNIRLCNMLTLYLCTLFLVQGGKWTGSVLPDDDKRYAIETCRSNEKCFKKVV